MTPPFTLTSPSVRPGGTIPARHTCDGADVSPQLAWGDPPPGTRSFALTVTDPDAPRGTFVHWVAWGIPAGARGLAEGDAPPHEGVNGFRRRGYGGPCPPPGTPHRYVFRLHALDAEAALRPDATLDDLAPHLEAHTLEVAELTALYGRA